MGAVRDIMNELRRRGATVHEWSGWDGRGNAGVSQISPVGAVIHHTATAYGFAFQALVTGRSDLPGTLCNFSGNVDGSFTVISSGLAYHAGRGAGPSLGPLVSVAGNLNGRTVGLEIVYPGNLPMTQEQYNSAVLFGQVVADLFAGGNAESIRFHAETNGVTGDGKWDPGYAPSKTYDPAAFRQAVRTREEGFLMALSPAQQQQMYDQTAKPFVLTGKDQGQILVDLNDFLTKTKEYTGIPAAEVLHQIYSVLADNYVQSGESIGKTASDTEKKVDAVTKEVKEIKVMLQAIQAALA